MTGNVLTIAATLLALLGFFAFIVWVVWRDRGKVQLSEFELVAQRFRQQTLELQRTIGLALIPAIQRANAAAIEFNRAFKESVERNRAR